MSVAQLIDVPVEVFGGRNTSMPPSDLPSGSSSLNQDVEFPEGAVCTRTGLAGVFPALPGNPNVNGLAEYRTPTFLNRLMVLDALGDIYRYDSLGNRSVIGGLNLPGMLLSSTTAFGREYMAFFNSPTGGDIPRQFDDTNFDRVSQVGPGAAPIVTDDVLGYDIKAAPNGLLPTASVTIAISETSDYVVTVDTTPAVIPAAARVGDIVTISGCTQTMLNAPFYIQNIVDGTHFEIAVAYTALAPDTGTLAYPYFRISLNTGNTSQLLVDQTVAVSAATLATYDGSWLVRVINSGSDFTVSGGVATTGLAASGGGTIASTGAFTGSITAGLHGVSVAFITRQGYITKPSPPNFWTAIGSKRAIVTQIPIGPANVVARLLIFTPVITPPATTGNFYSDFLTMKIPDNTSTSWPVDFLDSTLIASFDAGYLFGQQEIGECTSVGSYNSRMVWLGERNKVSNFLNLTFDGGWRLGGGTGGSDVPLGWTSDPTSGAGGSRDTGPAAVFPDGYRITGDGVTALLGMINQPAYQDYLGVNIIRTGTAYSYRVRAFKFGVTAGGIEIQLYSPSAGILGSATFDQSAMPNARSIEMTGTLMAAQAVIPADTVLRILGISTLSNAGYITLDCLEIFPTLEPVNGSNARVSYVNNPESYDGVTGNIGVRSGDGQVLRAQFPLRNNYYLAKDNYLCYVTDDGTNEPAFWAVNEASATIGICGPNAVAWTEEWAVFAHRSGFYVCLGSDPIKINQEIMEDASKMGEVCWNSINWNYGHTIWVKINAQSKQILVGAPVNGATIPNVVFMMDYKFNSTADNIAAGPGVVYSAFSGRLLTHGGSRKWTIWNLTAPCCALVEQVDGTLQDYYGNGVGSGLIYNRPAGNYLDDGAALNSFWSTPALPSVDQEQMLQLRSHRKIFGYLTGRVTGSANLPGAVVTMTQTGPGYVQVVMSYAHGLNVNDWVVVSNASDTTYNGYYRVFGTPGPFTFIYQRVTSLPAATGATVTGTLNIWVATTKRINRLRGVALSPDPVPDFERPINIQAERAVVMVGTSVPGGHFQLEKLIPSLSPDPTIPIRGSGL